MMRTERRRPASAGFCLFALGLCFAAGVQAADSAIAVMPPKPVVLQATTGVMPPLATTESMPSVAAKDAKSSQTAKKSKSGKPAAKSKQKAKAARRQP